MSDDDWDISGLLDERKLDTYTKEEIVALILEDAAYLLRDATFDIKEDKDSL
jgi:hypothetical protein